MLFKGDLVPHGLYHEYLNLLRYLCSLKFTKQQKHTVSLVQFGSTKKVSFGTACFRITNVGSRYGIHDTLTQQCGLTSENLRRNKLLTKFNLYVQVDGLVHRGPTQHLTYEMRPHRPPRIINSVL